MVVKFIMQFIVSLLLMVSFDKIHERFSNLNFVGTERTMVLKSQGWRYNKKGFEEVFLPLSETCRDPSGENEDYLDNAVLCYVLHLRSDSRHVAGLPRHPGGGAAHRGQCEPPAALPPPRRPC